MRIQNWIVMMTATLIQIFLYANTGYANTVYQHDDYCKKVDGFYTVNSFWKPSFVTNNPLGEVKQVIKKWSYLFISELFKNKYGSTETEYTFELNLYEYSCKNRILSMISTLGISPPSNYTISSPEIDMIDSNYIIVRTYTTYTDGYEFMYYDRQLQKDFWMDATNSIPNFNTILDYKLGKNGKWKVLVRFADMKKKWMHYDLNMKSIY